MPGEKDLADAFAGESRRETIANILKFEAEALGEPVQPEPELDEVMERMWLGIEERHRSEGEI